MNNTPQTICDEDELLNTFAAELTHAAYPIALKYGVSGSSLDLELKSGRCSSHSSTSDVEASRGWSP